MQEQQHENNIKINNRVTIYGNVTLVGSISLVSVGALFLAIWLVTHWTEAILVSAILVYGVLALLGLVSLGLVSALWVRLVIAPYAGAYTRVVEARGQELRNKLVHYQDNAVVLVNAFGHLEVVPLLPEKAVRVVEQEPTDESVVLELFDRGLSLKTICESTGLTYYKVQKITSEHRNRANSDQ